MLEKQVHSLEEQVHELERALGRGQTDLNSVRILQLKDNPSAAAEQVRWEELISLRKENEALRASTTSGVPSESLKVFELKIQQLEQELETKDKRMARLKQVLNAQVQAFRESICCILGYRVDLQPHGTIKLSCIYAPNRILEFDAKGTLLRGGDEDDLRPGREQFYERAHVPAFMGWMTLHLFKSPL